MHHLERPLKSFDARARLGVERIALYQIHMPDIIQPFKALGVENALIIDGSEVDQNFAKAARNIPNIDVLPVAGLNVYDVMRRHQLVITKDALDGIGARFEAKAKEGN